MKKFTFLFLSLFLCSGSFSQNLRYINNSFNQVDTLEDVEYARADFLNNKIALLAEYNIHDGENKTENRPLYMDIFMPHADTVTKRPAIIFAHSGAFLIGSRKADDMIAFCDSFARRGYVTATIDYRMGMGATVSRFLGIPINIKIEYSNGYRAAYRAGQDARAAIRYLKHNAEEYGIDTSKVYFAGSSAGGILGLYNLYNDKPQEFTEAVFSEPSLGSLDTIGEQGYGGKANAVVSMWGAVQDTKYIENESTPVFLIHGTADPIVPFKKGIPLDSIIPENPVLSFTMPETYGSYCVDTALTNRNIYHETYFVDGGIHELYGVDTGEFYEDGPNQYWDTIQNKMSQFYFKLFKPEAVIGYYMNNLEFIFYDESAEPAYSFWDFGDGSSATGEIASHTYNQKGIYNVRLTTCNQNMACDTVSTNIAAGIIDNLAEAKFNEIKIYPNPVKNQINVLGIDDDFDAQIYDLTGRLYFTKMNIQNNTIDISGLQNGIYFIKISSSNHSVLRKFFKVN